MGKPRGKLPTLASRNTVTCIDASDASRNPSVLTPIHTTVSPCLASSLNNSLGQQQQPSSCSPVTDLAANVYRTSTPRRYEDWLLVKDHLIYISDDDTLENCLLRQQEEHFVTLHYNFTYERIIPRWTNIPPPSSSVLESYDVPEIPVHSPFDFQSYFDQYTYDDTPYEEFYDVPADNEVYEIQHEDYPLEQSATIIELPQALQSTVSVIPDNVSITNEFEFGPIDVTKSIRCGIMGSNFAFVQPGGEELLQHQTLHQSGILCDTKTYDMYLSVPYNYRKRRRR